MRILNNTLVKILTRNNVATEETLKPLIEEAERSSRPLQDIVLDSKLVSETDLTKLFAQYADIPYIEVDPRNIPSEVLNRIPERIARQYNAVVFQVDEDGAMHLAMDDPDDVLATNFIEKEIGNYEIGRAFSAFAGGAGRVRGSSGGRSRRGFRRQAGRAG